ncbi:unnamed protein product, partial [Ectocarpus sp. 4 AP-2014]
ERSSAGGSQSSSTVTPHKNNNANRPPTSPSPVRRRKEGCWRCLYWSATAAAAEPTTHSRAQVHNLASYIQYRERAVRLVLALLRLKEVEERARVDSSGLFDAVAVAGRGRKRGCGGSTEMHRNSKRYYSTGFCRQAAAVRERRCFGNPPWRPRRPRLLLRLQKRSRLPLARRRRKRKPPLPAEPLPLQQPL